MLDLEQYKIISEQIQKENASEFIKELLNSYTNTVERTSELINWIPRLAEKQLNMKQKIINQYSWATDLLISDRHLHPHRYQKSESNNQFITLLYTCKAHFESGNAEGQSQACTEFFNEFIEVLKKKKDFDYTNAEDWDWIYTSAVCADWLESVIKQNIDNKFVKPKNKRIRMCGIN